MQDLICIFTKNFVNSFIDIFRLKDKALAVKTAKPSFIAFFMLSGTVFRLLEDHFVFHGTGVWRRLLLRACRRISE